MVTFAQVIIVTFALIGTAIASPLGKTRGLGKSRATNIRIASEEVPADLQLCESNLKEAANDGPLTAAPLILDKDKFGTFVNLQSGGQVSGPLTFDFVTIFLSQACVQCIARTDAGNCCVGSNPNIVLDRAQITTDDYLDMLFQICSAVDSQISILFPSAPTSSPTLQPVSEAP